MGAYRQDRSDEPLVPIAKYVAVESALECAAIAQRFAGSHGYFSEHGIDRYLRDFYGLSPIVGSQPAIETQLGARTLFRHQLRMRAAARKP